ncbi:hypothetical protein AK812_SmicGene33703 [Symbiodinium microadriaticum]|uniref:Uncharacterized protein n=1 Tax=Symbiodinium microadriaticum TaxID=2951 RepID=A0A1Q9CQZ0_SYMMI|nr:hypothetical protein AK812_SmicGene33703 [Symbiodinium microadriaticum]
MKPSYQPICGSGLKRVGKLTSQTKRQISAVLVERNLHETHRTLPGRRASAPGLPAVLRPPVKRLPHCTLPVSDESKLVAALAQLYAVGADGGSLGVPADDRRRLDLVVYEVDEAALKVAERRKHCTYPELARGRPQKLLVLGSEIGGHWSTAAQGFVRDLVRLRALPPPPAVRGTVSSGWASRWWGALSVAVQLAVARTALGRAWPAAPLPGPSDGPALDRVLDLAADAGPSRVE